MKNAADVRRQVRTYYGTELETSGDLKTNACCASEAPSPLVAAAIRNVHPDVQARFYGCGFPIPEALEDLRVLDLGCGSGRDVYVLAQLVGAKGRVYGVDMTSEQLAIARRTLPWHMDRFGYTVPNVDLHQGYIEDLSMIESGSLDAVVSNCVVNLSPDKPRVFSEVQRVLRPGGEFHLADVVADRRLPPEVSRDPLLYGECLGGALYEADLSSLARRTGFLDPREQSRSGIVVQNDEIRRKVGCARFWSVTWRLFKLDGLDEQCEDYGQVATYRGSIRGHEAAFRLDDHHLFDAGRPERVCGNTAAMLSETRLAPHFEVIGDRSVHFGVFPCGPTLAAQSVRSVGSDDAGGSCC